MSAARLRALTRDRFVVLDYIICVEMSAARLRALTRIHDDFYSSRIPGRNECGPFEGIDTFLLLSLAIHNLVEMSAARLRALTQIITTTIICSIMM